MNNMLSDVLEVNQSSARDGLGVFIRNYYNYVEKACSIHSEEPGLTAFIEEFISWLDVEGAELLQTTLERLDTKKEKKVKGFIEYYDFLLSGAKCDTFSLIDLLFAIPGQLAKEFMPARGTLYGSICNLEQADLNDGSREYTFNTQGTFKQVPYFMHSPMQRK